MRSSTPARNPAGSSGRMASAGGSLLARHADAPAPTDLYRQRRRSALCRVQRFPAPRAGRDDHPGLLCRRFQLSRRAGRTSKVCRRGNRTARDLERMTTACLPTTASTSASGVCPERAAANKWRHCCTTRAAHCLSSWVYSVARRASWGRILPTWRRKLPRRESGFRPWEPAADLRCVIDTVLRRQV
ncbi:hypothetical protein FHX61_004715 [Cupriavidus alkaliphilus]|uniref:Uncharacterized protein n=1 Tax=Cupriavidus alkaliphilus TaxID=942866 RepID=A0A7W4VED7_9BURK|nr:hypothetical protein [Cupriavidus alkaliphilus]